MNEYYKEYMEAGKISAQALDYACKKVKVGANLFEIAESTEEFIRKKGAGIAFPCNLSINNQAAHFTPAYNDPIVFGEKDVVKVDCGAQVDGLIGDNARTIDLSGENGKLLEAAEKALENVISTAKAGINSKELSKVIQDTIVSYGFNPVRNLSGHMLQRYALHSGYSVPNCYPCGGFELEEDMVIAIEPFASTGEGYVKDSDVTEIFSLEEAPMTRNKHAREIFEYAETEYSTLPFAERWLNGKFGDSFTTKMALRELVKTGSFHAYPVLKDIKGSLVSQFEHTLLITKDSCEITTVV